MEKWLSIKVMLKSLEKTEKSEFLNMIVQHDTTVLDFNSHIYRT